MSEQVIDERVVSMKFDNEEFEKKSAQSLSTIQKLKQALNFKDAVKGLDNLEKASKSMDISHIGNSIDAIKDKFNGWEVAARTAIMNVTNSAVNSAKRMIESVTIDPVRTGLGVYEKKLSSVQTMVNNSGEGLAKVNEVLDDLNDYSDKTIFSLNDMTTALGKFTAQGVGLEQAAKIIKGAANEAASMGAGSAEFSRFIYNLTQAYGMGKMTTIDWRSLENAGVAGKKFKDQLVASYEAMAKLGKVTDKYVGQVNSSNLREFLQYGIITADVMTDTFEKYADITTELGKNAQDAAQQIKTFHQLLDVLAESVASTWSQSFGYIIGDFNEARALWTGVSKLFDATVGKMNESRNKLLKGWHDGFIDPAVTSTERLKEFDQAIRTGAFIGDKDVDARISGRTMLLDGLANVLSAIVQVIKPVNEAFREFFPAMDAKNLWEATKNFRDFTAHLKLSSGALKEIKDAARGVFSVLTFGKTLIKDIIGALIPASKEVDSLAVIIIKIAGLLGRTITRVIETIRASEGYKNALDGITYAAGLAVKIVSTLIKVFAGVAKYVKDTGALQKAFTFLGSAIEVVVNLLSRLAPAAVVVFKVVGAAIGAVLLLIGKGLEVVEGFFGNLFGGKKSGDKSGQNIVAGITQGVENNVKDADKAMDSLAKGMINTFAKDIDSHSPSLVFAAFGAMIVAGLVVGISKSAGMLSQSENQILQFVGRIGQGISDVVSKIKYYFVEIKDDSGALVTYMQNAETTVTENSVGLLDRIGTALRGFVSNLKSLNVAAIVVVGIIGILLYNVTRMIATFYSLGDAARNGMNAVKRISKGFENMTKAFKRMHSPLVETLKGVAICVMGIAASIWLLSTLKDSGKLAPALASLLISFGLIMAVIVGAAKIAHNNELTDDIKNLAIMVLTISGSFVLMSFAFEQMNSVMTDAKTTVGSVFASLGVILAIAGILVGAQIIFSKFSKDANIKDILTILAWTFSIVKVVNALEGLIKATAPLQAADIGSVWLGGILPILALMGAIALMGVAFKDTGVGSALTVITMILAVKAIINTIAKIPWDTVVEKINSMRNTLIFLGILVTTLVGVLSLSGEGFKDFAKGFLLIVASIGGMVLVCKALKKLQLPDSAINQAIKIAVSIGLLASALIIVMHFADVPVGKFTGFSLMLLALDTVMLTMAKVVKEITSVEWGGGTKAFQAVAGCIAGLSIALAALAFSMTFTKDAQVGKFALVVASLALVILAISHLGKIMLDLEGGTLVSLMVTVGLVFAGLFFLIAAMSHIHDDVNTKPLIGIIGGLLVIFGSIALLATIPWKKLLPATASMAVLMGMLFLLIAAMSHIHDDVNTKPLIAIVVGIGVIAVSLMLLSNYDWDKLFVSMGVMVATMAAFALIIVAMKGISADAVGPMLVAVIAVLAVAASLGFLAMMNWPGIIEAAISLSATLLAVAAALRIVSGGTGGAGSILASAGAILIVAGSLIVIAYALNTLKDVPFDNVFMAGIAIGTIALALKVLADNATRALIASVAMIAVAAALVVIGAALNMFTLVASGDVWAAIGMITILTVALYALSAVAPMALVASIALVLTAAALLVLGDALIKIGEAQAGAGTLTLIALALIPMAIAGVLLSAGAAGLIAAAIGLRILAPALVTMGEAYKNFTGSNLAGYAGGLMLMGIAGVVLGVGATGLILGGVGMSTIAGALALMSLVKISGDKLNDLADGVMGFAKAGILGIIAGMGLIELAAGLLMMAQAITNVSKVSVAMAEIDFAKLANESIEMGSNIIEGLAEGIRSGLPLLQASTLMMSSVIENTFRQAMGINSPSILMQFLGKFLLAGLGEGITDKLLNGQLSEAMKDVADNLLGSFTEKLGSGFGKIEEMFNKFNKTEKKWVKTGGHYEYGRGWVEEGYWTEDSMFGDLTGIFSKMKEEFSTMFDVDGFKGVGDFKDIVGDMDFDVNNVTKSLGNMNVAMDGVDTSNAKMTDNMAKSIDVFSEYDRSLTMTTADIKKNLLDNLIGEEEFANNLNNLLAVRFDPQLVKKIADMGASQGNKIAAALLGGINDPNFVKWYNDKYHKTGLYAAEIQMYSELAEAISKGETTIDEANIKLRDSVQYRNGQMEAVNPDWDYKNAFGDTDKIAEASDEALAKIYAEDEEFYKRLKEQQEEAKRKADKDSNEEVADQAVADLSEAIKGAIDKHMPADSFVNLGKNICIGLASGIWGYMNLSTKAIQMSAKELINEFMQVTDEHSPSKVFYRLGEYIQEGLANGITNNNEAVDSTKKMGENLLSQFKSVLNDVLALMEMDETWQPTIRPVVDFTNIQSGAYEAQNAFKGVSIGAKVNAVATDVQASKAINSAPTVSGMSKEEFRDFLTGFAETIVEGITSNDGSPVEVNVNLEGDAKGIFRVVKEQNTEYKKTSGGRSALA